MRDAKITKQPNKQKQVKSANSKQELFEQQDKNRKKPKNTRHFNIMKNKDTKKLYKMSTLKDFL